MVYKLSLQTLPEIEETYEIERKTLWKCADRRAILILITEGACRIDLDDNNLTLSKGDYLLIPPRKEYIRRPVNDKSCKLLYVHFLLSSPIDSLSNKEADDELKEIINKNTSLSLPKRLSLLPTHLYIKQHGNTGDDFDELC
ncbi:MAG: AraC family ligand binding domain-containing protein, partial [Clostridia bacterium]|nr:AraC family ligand binding domain-containing protein [Clostridia bacterium]